MKKGELKGYARKRELGLVPYRYDTNSPAFNKGAWRNLNPDEFKRNKEALERRSNDN